MKDYIFMAPKQPINQILPLDFYFWGTVNENKSYFTSIEIQGADISRRINQ